MRRSPLVHVVALVITLPVSVVALVLLTMGSYRVWQSFQRFDLSLGALVPGLALQAGGIALLIAVLLTGIWSSAGLLSIGVLSLFGVLSAVLPALALGLLRGSILPLQILDTLTSGILQVTFTVLFGAGLAARLARRAKRRTHGGMHALALIGSLVLIVGGIWLTVAGLESLRIALIQSLGANSSPVTAVLHLLGVVLIAVGVILARWSPLALLLPGLIVAGLSIFALAPGFLTGSIVSNPHSFVFLIMAGGATASVLIASSMMLTIVRRRAAYESGTTNATDAGVQNPYAQEVYGQPADGPIAAYGDHSAGEQPPTRQAR